METRRGRVGVDGSHTDFLQNSAVSFMQLQEKEPEGSVSRRRSAHIPQPQKQGREKRTGCHRAAVSITGGWTQVCPLAGAIVPGTLRYL